MADSQAKGVRPIPSLFLLTVFICVLITPATAETPDTVYVNASYDENTPNYGTLNFSSIQEAVYSVAEGGEIWVYNGTYNESIVIDRGMTVTTVAMPVSPDSPGATIDALGEQFGVEITAGGVTFSGFDVKNASTAGIFAHSANTVTIEYNRITIRDGPYGILVAGAEGADIGNNEVRAIGSSTWAGIVIHEATGARMHDNNIVAILRHRASDIVDMEPDPIVAAFAPKDEEPSFDVGVSFVLRVSSGIVVIDSSTIAIERNRIVAVGNCTGDTPVRAYGIASGGIDHLTIQENNITAIGKAADGTMATGIFGGGDNALIQENTVRVITESSFAISRGIALREAEYGQVLDNRIDMRATCLGSIDEEYTTESIGIEASNSRKAQILRNDIRSTLTFADAGRLACIAAEGIAVELCDESRVSDNIAIVNTEIFNQPADGDETAEGDEPLALRTGEMAGIGIKGSDKPEICGNLVQVSGTVGTFDEKVPKNPITGALSTLSVTGIHIRGYPGDLATNPVVIRGYPDDLITNPVIHENVVMVGMRTYASAGMSLFSTDVESALADNSGLLARYTSMMREDREEELSAAAHFAENDGLPPCMVSDLEFTPDINEITFVQVRTRTAGIILEDILDPVVSCNKVPVYQNAFVMAFDLHFDEEEEATFAGVMPVELIDQAFSDGQVQKAAVLSLINDNSKDLSEAERAAITDAVLAGDAGALRACTARENLFAADSGIKDAIDRYRIFLESENPLRSLNATNFAAAVPISMSYGLLCNAEGDVDIYENNFTVLTKTINQVLVIGDNLDKPDAAAGSAGLVAAFGISGTSDSIRIADNSINVETTGSYVSTAMGGNITTSDAVAGTVHLLLAVGVSADAADEHIIDNDITVTQEASAVAQAINQVKDEMALSVAAMASLGVGIVLDPYEVLDAETYEPALPAPGEEFTDIIRGNTISIADHNEVDSLAMMSLSEPLDGSSNVLAGTAGAVASFGIVAPKASVMDNVIDVYADQTCLALASISEMPLGVILATEADLPGAGALNLGVTVSGGILTVRSYIENNTVFSAANSLGIVSATTEELLENADAFAAGVAIDLGIVSLSPSLIDGNSVDGDLAMGIISEAEGDRVDGGLFGLGLDIGILSVGSDATFNNIHNGYMGFPYYYDDEEYEPYADYNWWGDASGPSGLGPGTGSPVIGTMNYEPWLTRPADVVLATGKSYFGLEIGSPNIGGDGYRSGLEPGWTTLSFPLALENSTWQAVTHTGGGLDYSVAWTWDAAGQKWVQMTATSTINPLDAVYIRMNDYDRLPVAISPEITSPPVKMLRAGWNLVGPAYGLVELDENFFWWGEPYGTSVRKALASAEETSTGLTGYVIVVSPPINPESWVYTRGDANAPDMDATCGYWVYMKNPVELAGFSSTPLPMPVWAWDL